jgi:hypothetical protein
MDGATREALVLLCNLAGKRQLPWVCVSSYLYHHLLSLYLYITWAITQRPDFSPASLPPQMFLQQPMRISYVAISAYTHPQ